MHANLLGDKTKNKKLNYTNQVKSKQNQQTLYHLKYRGGC